MNAYVLRAGVLAESFRHYVVFSSNMFEGNLERHQPLYPSRLPRCDGTIVCALGEFASESGIVGSHREWDVFELMPPDSAHRLNYCQLFKFCGGVACFRIDEFPALICYRPPLFSVLLFENRAHCPPLMRLLSLSFRGRDRNELTPVS